MACEPCAAGGALCENRSAARARTSCCTHVSNPGEVGMLSFGFPCRALAAAIAVAGVALFGVAGAGAAGSKIFNPQNLVTDSSAFSAVVTDAALLNPWGLSATAT